MSAMEDGYVDFVWPELWVQESGVYFKWTPLHVLITLFTIVSLRYLWPYFAAEDESPEAIKVPEPEAAKLGWKGQVLEEPAIKVFF